MITPDPGSMLLPQNKGQGWRQCGSQQTFFHDSEREGLFNPSDVPGGPGLISLSSRRLSAVTGRDGQVATIQDNWRGKGGPPQAMFPWAGPTTFFVGALERPESSGEPGERDEVPPTAVPPQSVEPGGPWAGDHPPRNPFGDAEQYVRLPSGVWCVTGSPGRRYPVDDYGGRWTKQRLRMPVATEHRRPAEVPTAVW
eukprot:7034252-Alexandrium_andersonii.AAC.1